MLVQLQYRIPEGLRFDSRTLARWRGSWLARKPLPAGVVIRPVVWDRRRGDVRRWLKGHARSMGAAGVVDRYAHRNVTMLDFDTVRHVGTIGNIFAVARCLNLKPRWIEYARSKRGWHVSIYWERKFSPLETVALQAILGSDRRREMFNLARVLYGKADKNKRWNLLFMRKVL
jgi:hypothetical protein